MRFVIALVAGILPATVSAQSLPSPAFKQVTVNGFTITGIGGLTSGSGGVAPLASPAFTGTPTAPTPSLADSSTKLATTAWVTAQGYGGGGSAVTSVAGRTGAITLAIGDVSGAAPLASPTFTGVPAAPTAAASTNTTQVASTAFVVGQAATVAPLQAGTAAVGISTLFARQDHVHPTDTSRAAASTTIAAGTGLSGGGDLSANRTIAVATNGITASLMAQAPALTLRGNITGSTANVADSSPTAVLDAAFGSTQGSVLYRGASAWTVLGPGTSTQFLQSGGPAANPVWSTPTGSGNVSGAASSVAGNIPTFADTTGKLLADGGKALPTGAVVGTTDTQTLTNKSISSGQITGLAASATTDTTNAANISSGTLGAARLPAPAASTLGGVNSILPVTNQFMTSIGTSGLPTLAQPAFTNLSGSAACTQLPALTGNVTTTAGACATTIATNAISNAMLRQSAALSIIGNAGSSTANVADIVGTANQVARVNSAGTALAFGQVNLASPAAVTGALPVANGGTGQTAAGAAAANAIGAAESGANSTITSLTGLTTPLSAAQGGTGNAGVAWTAFTPSLTATGGAGVSFSGQAGAYQIIGKTLYYRATWTTTYTTAPVPVQMTLPNSTISKGAAASYGFNTTSGTMEVGNSTAAGTIVTIYKYDGTTPFSSSGQVLVLSGTIEIQ